MNSPDQFLHQRTISDFNFDKECEVIKRTANEPSYVY